MVRETERVRTLGEARSTITPAPCSRLVSCGDNRLIQQQARARARARARLDGGTGGALGGSEGAGGKPRLARGRCGLVGHVLEAAKGGGGAGGACTFVFIIRLQIKW